MDRYLRAVIASSAALVLFSTASAQTQHMPDEQLDMKSAFTTADFSTVPAMPQGKSTVLGGQIRDVDPVLDQFTLHIFGERPLKILFDERTQIYRNGKKIALRELRPEEHASVQTVLEGPKIFAISIHMLSDIPQGECQGHVLDYDPATRELTIGSSLSRDPIRIWLRENTPVTREGQGSFASASAGQADLVNGSLVAVMFDADEKGKAVASRVTVLARPGSKFAFSGRLSGLDMHAGVLVIEDPRDRKSYQISFDPARIPATQTLHIGDPVRVSASFDQTRYTAVDIVKTEASSLNP